MKLLASSLLCSTYFKQDTQPKSHKWRRLVIGIRYAIINCQLSTGVLLAGRMGCFFLSSLYECSVWVSCVWCCLCSACVLSGTLKIAVECVKYLYSWIMVSDWFQDKNGRWGILSGCLFEVLIVNHWDLVLGKKCYWLQKNGQHFSNRPAFYSLCAVLLVDVIFNGLEYPAGKLL